MLPLLPTPLALDRADRPETARRLQQYGYALLQPEALADLCHVDAAALTALQPAWHDLPPDAHLKDGGRYRRRRHASYIQDTDQGRLDSVPHRPHWQPTTYNALHGGMLRWFEPLTAALADAPAFEALLRQLGHLFAQARRLEQPDFDGRWYIEAHPFRIDTTDGVGRPTPEGAHRDGVDYVAVLLADRVAVRGGETRVFEAEGPHGVRFTLQQPWSALLIDDQRVIHESTPIQPEDGSAGYRDTLVLTYRSGGFQDPPESA